MGMQNQVNLVGHQQFEPTVNFAQAFNTMTLTDPSDNQWYMDTEAIAHLAANTGTLTSTFNYGIEKSVIVDNGSQIPITLSGSVFFPTKIRPLSLTNVLVTHSIIKNLIYVRRFIRDNSCSIEFDPFDFSVVDLQTRRTILHSDSTGDLYPVFPFTNNASQQQSALITISPHVWHRRLAHPSNDILNSLISASAFPYNKSTPLLCTACELGKIIKLPFFATNKSVDAPFDLIHSDVWSSPVLSLSGILLCLVLRPSLSFLMGLSSATLKRCVFQVLAFCKLC